MQCLCLYLDKYLDVHCNQKYGKQHYSKRYQHIATKVCVGVYGCTRKKWLDFDNNPNDDPAWTEVCCLSSRSIALLAMTVEFIARLPTPLHFFSPYYQLQ